MFTRRRIVVGLAHTPSGAAALGWALDQGVLRNWEVVAVRAFDLPVRPDRVLEKDLAGERQAAHNRAQAWTLDAIDEFEDHGRVRVITMDGEVAQVLAKEARRASLLVIGTPWVEDNLVDRLSTMSECPLVHVDADGSVHDVYTLAASGLG